MASSTALELLPIRANPEASSLRLIAAQPERSNETLIDTLQLRDALSNISRKVRDLSVTVAYAPQGREDRTLLLRQIYPLLLEQRVHAVTVTYRVDEQTHSERFVCARDGILHTRVAQ